MAIAKVCSDFSTHNYSDKELSLKSKTIGDNLTDIPVFVSLAETAAAIKAKKIGFDDFLSKMQDGNKQITVLKNNARFDLESILKTGALKVQDISGGDEAIILSSGYDIARKGTPVGMLDQVVNLQIKLGKLSGSLEISWDVVDHAYSYEIQYTKNPKTDESVYTSITSTKRKILLENLIPGQTYSIKVAAVGSDPKRVWSVEVISCYVS